MKTYNLPEIWKTTLAQIEIKLDSSAHYKTWFIPTELVSINGNLATVGVRNSYASDWLKKKHHDLVQKTISHVAGKDLDVEFIVSRNLVNMEMPKLTTEDIGSQTPILRVKEGTNIDFKKLLQQSGLNPEYSFKNFIVGPSNRLAHAASMAVCERPGQAYNPIFIFGDTGLGKSHLAQAIAQKILELSNGKKVLNTPSENFLNEMVSSIKAGKTQDFRNKYRLLDVIIIDDIQLISKWEQTQDELFNTFNALHGKNKQIILVSDRHPEKIHNLESRLKSRFQGGIVVQMEKPDYETRLAILEYKSRISQINLNPRILEYIASNATENIRVLEGNLRQISLFNNIHTHELTLEEVASLLGTDKQSKRERIKPKDIVKSVAKEFQVTVKDIMGASRQADIAFARQVAMFLLREDYGYKLEEVAKILNRKDHTTVIHGVDKIKSKIELESGFEEQISQIRSQIK